MKDEVIQEVWRIKDFISAKYNHDVHALANHLRQSLRLSSEQTVDLRARRDSATRGGAADKVAEPSATYPERG